MPHRLTLLSLPPPPTPPPPAARIGCGILLDHGTGVVIGETAVVGNRVSMLQGVTLGGTGKEAFDRHPKIHEGVLIGVGATILGNISVGRGAMVAAGSLVLKNVPPHRWGTAGMGCVWLRMTWHGEVM